MLLLEPRSRYGLGGGKVRPHALKVRLAAVAIVGLL
jgi:hypothetical protein